MSRMSVLYLYIVALGIVMSAPLALADEQRREGNIVSADTTLNTAVVVERLRNTKAIGLLKKWELKREIEKLMPKFEHYHTGQGNILQADLQRNFTELFTHVLNLLQVPDPQFYQDLLRAQDNVWKELMDPVRLAQLHKAME